MSDPNLSDKISETITNVFKKTKVFEKIEKVEIYLGLFVIISSMIGVTNIYINYSNLNKIKNLEEKIQESENSLKHNIEINRKDNEIKFNKIFGDNLVMIDNQQKIIEKLIENVLTLNANKEFIASTPISTFSPIKSINSIDEWKYNANMCEDDELINECYDTIPLNNIKKNTGLSWLFK